MNTNPFELIDIRLSRIEEILKKLTDESLPEINRKISVSPINIVDIDGLIQHRPLLGSKSTIYKRCSEGTIPHGKNGHKLIFDLRAIDKWLEDGMNEAVDNEMAAALSRMKRGKRGYPKY